MLEETSSRTDQVLKPPPLNCQYTLDSEFFRAYSLAIIKRGEANKTTEYRYLLEWKAFWIMWRYYKQNFDSMFKYKPRMSEMSH